jgi:hypothetical protein
VRNLEKSKFKYLWRANFIKKTITQHPEDKYSGYDPDAEWNPSSFRDFQNYFDGHSGELVSFELVSKDATYTVDLTRPWCPMIYVDERGRWGSEKHTLIHREKRPLTNVRVIYYRNMETTIENGIFGKPRVVSYALGYQGLDDKGNCRKKVITVI